MSISPVNLTSLSFRTFDYNNQRLTSATKAQLLALGVDVSTIKTETEGKTKLRKARLEKASRKETYSSNKVQSSQYDELTEKVTQLAKDLGISVSSNDDITDLISKIKSAIATLKEKAGEDKSKLEKVADFTARLGLVENMQKSRIDLGQSMNITASQNRSFFGL